MLVPFSFMKTVPVVPVATAATGVGSTSFTANWNAFSGASYYLLDVSLSSSFSSFVLQDTVTTATSYVVTGLTSSTTYYYRVRAAINVDSDVAGFVSRVYTAGGTLSYTEVTATETLVADLKSYGIWTSMKAVYPMVGASAAACAQNLKSSSFTGTFSSGWTFASTGVTPNGMSATFNTGLNPSTALSSVNSNHQAVYLRTNNTAQQYVDIGQNNNEWLSAIYWTTNVTYIYNPTNAQTINVPTTNALNLSINTRRSSTDFVFLNNNSIIGNTTVLNTNTFASANVHIGSAGGSSFYSNRENAFASIGDGLTNTQASNFYTAVQTFNQTLNRQVGPQVVSDADAQAYINRVYTAGGTLTNTEANAVNQLTIDMKAAGIWTAMKAVYPMVGSSAAACAQNLKSSSFTGTFTSGWTFASTGVTGNGTSAYFDTTLVPNSNLSLNSCSFSVYSRSNFTPTANNSYGCTSSGSYAPLLGSAFTPSKGVDSYAYGFGTDAMASATGQNLAALFLTSRTSSSSAKLFRNSTSIATATTQGQTTQPTNSFTFGAFRNPGGFESYSSFQYAFAHIGDGLTDTQAASFYTCVQTFNTTLSRQV